MSGKLIAVRIDWSKNMSLKILETLSDRRIIEAEKDGAFDNLPGAGKPLDLYEDPLILENPQRASLFARSGYVERAADRMDRES